MDGPSRRPTDSRRSEGTPSLSEVPSGGARALWLLWGFSKVTRRKGGTHTRHKPKNGYVPTPDTSQITTMPIVAHSLIHRLAQPINPPNRSMRLKPEPRIKRLVITSKIQRRRIKILRLNPYGCHGLIRRIALLPFNAGVFDRHEFLRILPLNLQHKTRRHTVGRQLLAQGTAQKVRQVLVLLGQHILRATERVRRYAKLGIGCAELVGRHRKVSRLRRAGRRRRQCGQRDKQMAHLPATRVCLGKERQDLLAVGLGADVLRILRHIADKEIW